MNFKIEEMKKETQEGFIQGMEHTPFLQSSGWALFQEKIKNKARRLGVFDGNDLVGIGLVYEVRARFNSFLYIPWGPQFLLWNKPAVESLVNKVVEIAKKEGVDFIRFEPRTINQEDSRVLEDLGFKKNKSFTQPECTAIINLSKSEDDLLFSMSDSTRYNIRNVERKGVKVRKGSAKDIGTFQKLLKETANRHKFSTDIHEDYFKNQYEILSEERMMEVFLAEFEGVPLASSLAIFYGDTATYLHAASSRGESKLRATYLLVWKSILEAKNRGYKYFDFWGVAPENYSSSHPWSGVTSFKMSFGGERVCYSPVFDLPTSNKYLLSKFIEVSRRPLKKIFRV